MIRNPHDRWLWLSVAVASVLALVAGWWFYLGATGSRAMGSLSAAARTELAAVRVEPVRAVALEREWVANGFDPVLLVAPAGPMPCEGAAELLPPPQQAAARAAFREIRTGDRDTRIRRLTAASASSPDNPLIALMLGTSLLQASRYEEAEEVLKRALPEEPELPRPDRSDFELSLRAHLHHALGVARLNNPGRQPSWTSLEAAAKAAKRISGRGLIGGRESLNPRIVPVGCSPADQESALAFADLLNNFIVAYMRGSYRHPDRSELGAPLPKTSGAALQRLFVAQYEKEQSSGWSHESQLFALMMVAGIEQGLPADARLAINAVQVIDWWTTAERCPECSAELHEELRDIRGGLLRKALARRNVEAAQREAFARTVTRMLADGSFDRSKVAEDVSAINWWLPPDQREILDSLLVAGAARAEFLQWALATPGSSPPPRDRFGRYSQRWQSAVANDFAVAAAPLVARWPAADQRRVLVAFRRLTGDGGIPPELESLERNLPWIDRVRISACASHSFRMLLAVVFAVVLWLVLVWGLVQAWERRMMRTSLYNVEIEHYVRRDRP